MANYELTVELRTICTVKVEANTEEEASQKVSDMPYIDFLLWATDEEFEIVDVFELEETQ